MIDLKKIQEEQDEWRKRNFGDTETWQPVMGVAEEAGELCHAYLKMSQGIRGTYAHHDAEMIDAIGDIVVYLLGVCNHIEVDFESVIKIIWDDVKKRDWKKNPTGGTKNV